MNKKIKILKHKIIHRKYPEQGWEFKAICVHVKDDEKLKDVIYGTGIDKGKRFEGVEIYSGRNYVDESDDKVPYSKRYDVDKIPNKYAHIVRYAKSLHRKNKWSKKQHIGLN